MNKDIEKMLKYQEVDMRLYILDKKLKNADETKKWMEATSLRKSLRDDFVGADRDMDSEVASINKAAEDFESLLLETNDLENSIGDQANIEQIDYYLKKIDDLLKKIKDVENVGADSKRELEKLNESAENCLKQIVKCSQVIAKYKPQVEELKKEMLVEAKNIKAELDSIVKSENIDTTSKVYEVYKACSKRKMPVFVELNDRNCGGCGVEMSNNTLIKAEHDGYVECPNCGRIMYVK